ncbi:MAG: radical SAM protein [Elusimicrobia bacterium]|nr:radical SAM protein [Elusimicrobiota bacterium]
MRGLLGQFPYHAAFALSVLRGKPLAAVAGLSITDVCNLDCRHCWRKNAGAGHAPLSAVEEHLEKLYAMGGRYLYLQGGEPFLWRDGERGLTDVVARARAAGFFHVTVCTNGTFPLDAGPDAYSISIEGSPAVHDAIRCSSFKAVMENVRRSPSRNIFINATFNRLNAGDLECLVELARAEPSVRGVLVNFHIPYPGVEDLALDPAGRRALALRALELKARGLPILNSKAGLAALAANDWRRPVPVSVVSDCRKIFHCCRALGDGKICSQCGYAVWAEASRLLDFDPGALWWALTRVSGR